MNPALRLPKCRFHDDNPNKENSLIEMNAKANIFLACSMVLCLIGYWIVLELTGYTRLWAFHKLTGITIISSILFCAAFIFSWIKIETLQTSRPVFTVQRYMPWLLIALMMVRILLQYIWPDQHVVFGEFMSPFISYLPLGLGLIIPTILLVKTIQVWRDINT